MAKHLPVLASGGAEATDIGRACILGMLMPASADPKKDQEIFLKILTMDDDGAWQRQKAKFRSKPGEKQLQQKFRAGISECEDSNAELTTKKRNLFSQRFGKD